MAAFAPWQMIAIVDTPLIALIKAQERFLMKCVEPSGTATDPDCVPEKSDLIDFNTC
ncbi:hypothetical protein ACUXV3_03775 [Roseobacteraceae bacterium NS-SX3]